MHVDRREVPMHAAQHSVPGIPLTTAVSSHAKPTMMSRLRFALFFWRKAVMLFASMGKR